MVHWAVIGLLIGGFVAFLLPPIWRLLVLVFVAFPTFVCLWLGELLGSLTRTKR